MDGTLRRLKRWLDVVDRAITSPFLNPLPAPTGVVHRYVQDDRVSTIVAGGPQLNGILLLPEVSAYSRNHAVG